MPSHVQDDQALRLFRAAHADFAHRAPTTRRPDSVLDALVARVLDDTVRNDLGAGAARVRSYAPVGREFYLGVRAA